MQYKLPVISKDRYKNPVPFADGKSYTNPDPHVIKWCGTYYCYSSDDNGVNVSTSTDLVNWQNHGFALVQPEHKHYWAPSVIYSNGTFYMYYSNETNEATSDHFQFMKLATSDNPLGPFTYKKTFFEKFAIDTHPILWNGSYYMFYSPNDTAAPQREFSGTSIVVDRMLDMETLEGKPKPVVVPTSEQEIFARDRFKDGRDWHTIEGAVMWEDQETFYLLYSANAYINEDYFVGYSTATARDNLMDMEWHKYPRRRDFYHLIKRNDVVEGTGHNTIAKAPNLVDDWIVYHGRDASVPITYGKEERDMRIDRILYDEKEMITHGPSYEEQDAPAKPALFVEEVTVINDRTLYSIASSQCYKAQMWLLPENTTDGVNYGFILNKNDNYSLDVLLHSGNNTISVIATENNVRRVVAQAYLAPNYNHFVFHQLDVEKSFDGYKIYLDTQKVITLEGMQTETVEIGVTGIYCGLTVRGLAVTIHVSLYKDDIYKLGRMFQFQQPVWLEHHELSPNSTNKINAKRGRYHDNFTERFTLSPLLRGSSFAILNDGKEVFRLDNLNDDSNIWLFRKSGKSWVFAGKKVHDADLSGEISLQLDGLAIKGYSYTEN